MTQKNRSVTLRFLAQPTDVNFGGHVHGGSVMKWIDQAGYVCATGWCGNYCVTAYLGDLKFLSPIQIGDLIEVHAKVIYTGNTSMHTAIEVEASNPKEAKPIKKASCIIIFVSVDENGRPRKVPIWEPTNNEDICLEYYAKQSMILKKDMEKELASCLISKP
ncbi:MAG: acyl-CoA thioesterase [Candidatus Omnitrophica bacterium]|nr:acyl-CoA thioesterase [Candidatus Omnitrophota bacterium]